MHKTIYSIKIKQDDYSLYNTELFLLCLFLIKHIIGKPVPNFPSFVHIADKEERKRKDKDVSYMVLISTENYRGNESRKLPL